MSNIRSLIVFILGAVLSTASLMCAQNIKPIEPMAIQELALQPQPVLSALLFQGGLALPPFIQRQDLSRYRGFQFGMSLLDVAKRADMKPSDARVIHQRPAVIQDLDCWPAGSASLAPQLDSVQDVLFSFYNGELYQIVVSYNSDKTEGLTDEDMIEAISAKYGAATGPAGKIAPASSQIDGISEEIIARWEDSQYSLSLFRSSFQGDFGVLMFSKQLALQARTAAAEADKLDQQEAPQQEIESQKKQDEEIGIAHAKARLVNKLAFRP